MRISRNQPFFWPTVILFIGLIAPTLIYLFATNQSDYCGIDVKNLIYEKIYFSVVTFSTLGYGDISPLGWVKTVAAVQALFGPVTIGFFIYGYGKHKEAGENRKAEELEEKRKGIRASKNFDLLQYYRRDVCRVYSHFLNAFQLEYGSVFRQWYVCFFHTERQTMDTLNTHYHSFPRVLKLIENHISLLKNEYHKSLSTRPVYHAQALVDYHVVSVKAIVLRGNQYVGIDKELFERLTAEIRDGGALRARTTIIKDRERHKEPVDNLVESYYDSLQAYLEHVVYSIEILTLAPSVHITATPHSLTFSEEERKKFLKYEIDNSRDDLNVRDWLAWSR